MRATLLFGLALVPAACQRAEPTRASAASSAPSASPIASLEPAPPPSAAAKPSGSSSAVSAASAPAKAASGVALLESAKLVRLAAEPSGRFVAELERSPPAKASVVLSTKQAPLGPRQVAAHFRIAERVAPGLVAPTALRALPLTELAGAADPPTRATLQKVARVLGDGTVEVALVLAPSPSLIRVDVANLIEGEPAQAWETLLAAREPIPEAERTTLGLYQALLAVDYISENGARKAVYLHKKSGRITTSEGSFAFGRPVDGALSDAIERLTRHNTFSKSLSQHLRTLDRDALGRALGWGDPPNLLITPKQLDEVLERARSVRHVIEQREKQRGEAALELP